MPLRYVLSSLVLIGITFVILRIIRLAPYLCSHDQLNDKDRRRVSHESLWRRLSTILPGGSEGIQTSFIPQIMTLKPGLLTGLRGETAEMVLPARPAPETG
jgi:hypothetical protein